MRRNLSFKSVTLIHFRYRVVQLWSLTEVTKDMDSYRPGFTKHDDGSRQESKEDSGRWSSSPGIIPGEWSSGIPGVSRHNSREFPTGCIWIHQFPRRRQKRSWGPGFTPDTGGEAVLEAWCYTRAAGTEVIHMAATGLQGIPDCIARYNFPRIWRRLLNANGC